MRLSAARVSVVLMAGASMNIVPLAGARGHSLQDTRNTGATSPARSDTELRVALPLRYLFHDTVGCQRAIT